MCLRFFLRFLPTAQFVTTLHIPIAKYTEQLKIIWLIKWLIASSRSSGVIVSFCSAFAMSMKVCPTFPSNAPIRGMPIGKAGRNHSKNENASFKAIRVGQLNLLDFSHCSKSYLDMARFPKNKLKRITNVFNVVQVDILFLKINTTSHKGFMWKSYVSSWSLSPSRKVSLK